MKRVKAFIFFMCCFGSVNAYAFIDLNSITGGVFSALDKSTGGLIGVCYQPKRIDGNFDACALLDVIGDLELDVCSLVPPVPGFEKKTKEIGLSGLKAFCRAKQAEFANAISKTARDIATYTFGDKINELATLPNGKNIKTYLRNWNVTSIANMTGLNDSIKKHLLSMNRTALDLVKEKGMTLNNVDFAEMIRSVQEEGAPKTAEAYHEGVGELARASSDNAKQTIPSKIGAVIAGGIANLDKDEAKEKAQEILFKKQNQFELAKSAEIGQRIALARKPDDIAIPTQEYVDIIRADLKLEAVAKIKEQQMREAMIVAEVQEKWDKKYALAEIIADKEVIMAQKFEEDKVKGELDSIIGDITSKAKNMVMQQVSGLLGGIF